MKYKSALLKQKPQAVMAYVNSKAVQHTVLV